MRILKGSEQLIEAGWVSESVMAYHHHFGSSQAQHGRLGCLMPPAIWLWMRLLRETQAGANLQKTLPTCLRIRMVCSATLPLCVKAATVFLQSGDTFANTTCSTYDHCMQDVYSRTPGSCGEKPEKKTNDLYNSYEFHSCIARNTNRIKSFLLNTCKMQVSHQFQLMTHVQPNWIFSEPQQCTNKNKILPHYILETSTITSTDLLSLHVH